VGLAPNLTRTAGALAALGDPVRLGLVARLCHEGPLATAALREGTGLTRQAVTKHLAVLERAGMLQSHRTGRDRAWSIEAAQLAATRDWLDRLSAQWDRRIERLRALVEAPQP
jgi:DNA-binding transcriptional ArsR family regulator